MEKEKKELSWGIIILFMLLFWPIGIILLYIRLSSAQAAAKTGGSGLYVMGMLFVILGILCIIIFMSEGHLDVAIIALIFYIGGGVYMVVKSKKMMATNNKYKKYMNVISGHQEISITNISTEMSTSSEEAIEDIKGMIDSGYLRNAHLDLAKNCLVLAESQTASIQQ